MKLLLAAALLLHLTLPATGQGLSFLRPQTISIGDRCCSVLTGDFNKDGKTDIAVSHFTGGLTVLLGDGKGGFTRIETAQGLPPGMVIQGLVAAADLNSDGILDIIAITQDQRGYWSIELLGRGDGTFQAVVLGGDTVLAVGDFNGDGRPDLLVKTGVGEFAVRLGKGDGTFQPNGPAKVYPSGDFSWAVIADFNGDGKADVAQTTFHPCCARWVHVWLGNGDGTFRDFERVPLSSTGSRHLAVADFNGDGKPDLAVVQGTLPTANSPHTELLLGKGDGSFQTGKAYGDDGGSLAVADFNGDGHPDVATGFTVLLGKGDGSAEQPAVFAQFFIDQETDFPFNLSLVAVGDFNGDGKPDLVGPGPGATQLSILINNTPGADRSARAVSAANYSAPVAPGSIASVFGANLASATVAASMLPLPTVLANTRVRILDRTGVERLGGLFFVSPFQINFVVPPDTAPGYAIVNVDSGNSTLADGARSTMVQPIASGIFTTDGSGHGLPAATAIRIRSDGTRTPVAIFQCSSAVYCSPVPIDLSVDGKVYLSLYGTGFAKATRAFCNNVPAGLQPGFGLPVLYIGPQGVFAGLDQLNLELPKTIPSGAVEIECRTLVDSFRFTISIK